MTDEVPPNRVLTSTEPNPDSTLRYRLELPSGHAIEVRIGDLTREPVDAVVNAANCRLQHGGGVAGALSKAAGPVLQLLSDNHVACFGEVETGEAVPTLAGSHIPAEFVIHAVGPIFDEYTPGEADDLLRRCVWESLDHAERLACSDVSIPAISSGIFGFPKVRCAEVLFATVLEWVEENEAWRSETDPPSFGKVQKRTLKTIRFTNFDEETVSIFTAQAEKEAEILKNQPATQTVFLKVALRNVPQDTDVERLFKDLNLSYLLVGFDTVAAEAISYECKPDSVESPDPIESPGGEDA